MSDLRDNRRSAGFTLLEILVAMSIMAIVLVAVYRMHAQTISMANTSRFYTTALLLAQSKLADVERSGAEALSGDAGKFEAPFEGYAWKTIFGDVESEELGEIAEDLKRIEILISLDNDEYTYSIRTYRLFR